MARTADNPADETVTVRLPFGTAARVRAATGQPFSRIVRYMVIALLNKHTGEPNKMAEAQAEVNAVVEENTL